MDLLSKEDLKERLIVAEKVMKSLFQRNKDLEDNHLVILEGIVARLKLVDNVNTSDLFKGVLKMTNYKEEIEKILQKRSNFVEEHIDPGLFSLSYFSSDLILIKSFDKLLLFFLISSKKFQANTSMA
jgi:hypothetical protein